MTDVQKPMPVHSWRGIPFPVVDRSIRYSNDAVRHAVEYHNGQPIDLPSGGNDSFRYSIPASENLLPVAYKLWFSTYYDDFILAMKDRSPGTLIDAYRGNIRAVPITYIDEAKATGRDGPTLDVEFEESPLLDEVAPTFTTSVLGLVYLAETIDREVATVAWKEGNVPEPLTSTVQDWEENEPPEPSINPIDAVTGLIRKGELFVRRTTASFEDAARRFRKLEDAVEDIQNPDLYQLQARSRRGRLQALKTQSMVESRNNTVRVQPLREAMTLIEVANQYGMTLDEFLTLNPNLARSPIVPRGAMVKHPKRY